MGELEAKLDLLLRTNDPNECSLDVPYRMLLDQIRETCERVWDECAETASQSAIDTETKNQYLQELQNQNPYRKENQ